jgi:ketosteroid isomerase-like protein
LKSKRPIAVPNFVKVHNRKFRSEVQLESNWGFRITTREGAIVESRERFGVTEAAQLLLLLKG